MWKSRPDYPIGFPNSQISTFPNPSASSHEIDDLYLVPFGNGRGGVLIAFHDDEVALDGDAAAVDLERGEQVAHRERTRDRVRIAVQGDLQMPASMPSGSSNARSLRSPGLRMCAGRSTFGSGLAAASRITRS